MNANGTETLHYFKFGAKYLNHKNVPRILLLYLRVANGKCLSRFTRKVFEHLARDLLAVTATALLSASLPPSHSLASGGCLLYRRKHVTNLAEQATPPRNGCRIHIMIWMIQFSFSCCHRNALRSFFIVLQNLK